MEARQKILCQKMNFIFLVFQRKMRNFRRFSINLLNDFLHVYYFFNRYERKIEKVTIEMVMLFSLG